MPSNPMMIAAALACAAMTSLAQAQTRGDCVRVRLDAPLVLPDGSRFGPGELGICVERRLTPVCMLHSIDVDGVAIGLFLSQDRRSEEVDAPPKVAFQRGDDGQLRLAAYTTPDGGIGRTFRFSPVVRSTVTTSTPQSGDTTEEAPVWIAARLD